MQNAAKLTLKELNQDKKKNPSHACKQKVIWDYFSKKLLYLDIVIFDSKNSQRTDVNVWTSPSENFTSNFIKKKVAP